MFDLLASPYLVLFARLCVGGVLLASSATKLADREGTATALADYPFLPPWGARPVATFLPFIEGAVGLLLVFGLLTVPAAVAAILLFVLFTGLVLYDLRRGSTRSCHCFGRLSTEQLTPVAVLRNAVLLALAVLAAVAFDGWLALDAVLGLAPANGNLPPTAESVPVVLLSAAAVMAIAVGGRAASSVRETLRAMGFR